MCVCVCLVAGLLFFVPLQPCQEPKTTLMKHRRDRLKMMASFKYILFDR